MIKNTRILFLSFDCSTGGLGTDATPHCNHRRSCPLNNCAPLICWSATYRHVCAHAHSTALVFRGQSVSTQWKKQSLCTPFFHFLFSFYLNGRLKPSPGVCPERESLWIGHSEDVCRHELLQRSDGWAGSRAAAVRSGDGRKPVRLAEASFNSHHCVHDELTAHAQTHTLPAKRVLFLCEAFKCFLANDKLAKRLLEAQVNQRASQGAS